MNRATSVACLALALVTAGGSVAFAGKPSIAVLGLEVVDTSGTPTSADTAVAKALTTALRGSVTRGAGPYALAPHSEKELIDEKLLGNCDSEALTCMSKIGSGLGADFLVFGNIKKDGGGYKVTVTMIDDKKGEKVRGDVEVIPVAEATGEPLNAWGRKLYGKLTGEAGGAAATSGTIAIKAPNIDRGTILVDGQPKGSIVNGVGQVAGVAEGKHQVEIEAVGYQRWEKDVTVTAGQTSSLPAELDKAQTETKDNTGGGATTGGDVKVPTGGEDKHTTEGTVSSSSGNGMWKGIFIGSAVVAAGGAGWWTYNWRQISSTQDKLSAGGAYGGSCMTCLGEAEVGKLNKDGDGYHTQTIVGAAVLGVGAGVAIFAFYKGFIAKDDAASGEHAERGHRVRRDRFVVTPVVSPTGAGATVQLDW